MNRFLSIINNGCMVVLLIGGTTSFLLVVAVIALFRFCAGYNEIDIDNNIMKRRYEVHRSYVTDSTQNGFELLFYTTNAVTDKRYDEILTRKHIFDSYRKLESDAGPYFNNNLMGTDIYEFASWAKGYDIDPDVRLVNIWVYGGEYKKLYRRPNDNFPPVHTPYSFDIGILFLKENDVYKYNFESPQIYRYWQCEATSLSDERYNHVTEKDYLHSLK